MDIFAFFFFFLPKNSIHYDIVFGIISFFAVIDGLSGVA